ncbi:RidA family protein [Spirochaeta thermophila]|uniref:Endoribonuclease L-PSP n=2 Tax=Winmispira thermophila TaxID=154 RepID=G0GCS7_WINT7|nr:RidA family protein [Spirochaeta thermophila]ADN01200.1 putative endoribonuklease [Spirochaeta thermophila DSM 6192]AEJ60496.1 endoribonuclease L-PSP [Spirochaeta thermophila DSM 6578]
MEYVHAEGAPEAIGPYSQAVRAGEMVFCSGQIGLDPATGSLVSGSIEAEVRRALENLTAVLEAAGCTREDVVKTTIFLVDMADFEAVNRIYGGYFPHRPARSTVAVKALPRGARVEVECIAVRR